MKKTLICWKKKLDLLAISACPIDVDEPLQDYECMLQNDKVYYGEYNGSCVDTCRVCWLKYMSKESEDNHE